MRSIVVIMLMLIGMFLVSCSDDGAGAGEPCEPTAEGAKACASGKCLVDLQCPNGAVLNVCAGDECEKSDNCPEEHVCVVVIEKEKKYCVPKKICSESPTDGGTYDSKPDGGTYDSQIADSKD